MAEEILSIDEAQQAATEFLVGLHPGAVVSFSEVSLAAVGNVSIFEVKGDIRTGTEPLGAPPIKKFKLQVHPSQRKVIGYKF
jgi:hypothetical protein